MPAIKNYFDEKTRDKLLAEAIKKTKGKGWFPFAFGLSKTGGLLAIDFRNEHDPDKFLREIKKSEFKDKFLVGTAAINGKVIEMNSLHAKSKVKPIEVKNYLATLKTTVTRAIVDGVLDEEQAEGAAADKAVKGDEPAAAAKQEKVVKMNKMFRDLEAILAKI